MKTEEIKKQRTKGTETRKEKERERAERRAK